MRDELLPYYQRELAFIRQMAGEFRERYPEVASGLQLDANTSEDPHVERLIEAFALLAGRIHHKLDDEFPEITEGLLDVLYPHFLRPIPPLGILQFQFHAGESEVAVPVKIPENTSIHTKPEEGQVCSFRTCYPLTVRPLRVNTASIVSGVRTGFQSLVSDVAAAVHIEIECVGAAKLVDLSLDSLRFYLSGDKAVTHNLYEVMVAHAVNITILSKTGAAAALPIDHLRPVGFGADQGVLPYSDRSFIGYRLLQEYFAFPEKFLFFDLTGLSGVRLADFGNSLEIVITLKQADYKHRLQALEQNVDAGTFQLNCAPVVNLFERLAEPIRVTHAKTEYRIVSDQHRQNATEIFSVDRVTSAASYLTEVKEFAPFYSIRHKHDQSQRRFWHAHRRPSLRPNDKGTEIFLSLVDLDFKPSAPPAEMLTVHLTCTNRDQVSRLKLPGEFGEVEIEGQPLVEAKFIRKPTRTLRPPMRKGLQWRLISHLSLNHLSIVEKGCNALQEILRLYDFGDDVAIRRRISGITGIESKPCVSRFRASTGVTFCRGIEVTAEFDENEFEGTSVLLLATVLRHFLGLYSAVNSFTRFTAKTKKGALKTWPPLAGEQIVL